MKFKFLGLVILVIFAFSLLSFSNIEARNEDNREWGEVDRIEGVAIVTPGRTFGLSFEGEHIDAFCGRLPRSVRGQHYTDFSQERLKEIYKEAGIRVLT